MSRHRFHGDPERFDVLAAFVVERFPDARYIADVAGGQGMLSRVLRKKYGLEAEVVDPRGWALKGVPARADYYSAAMADYYDLVVGLHPDEATREVVESAAVRDVLIVPCCNFWAPGVKLGQQELIDAIVDFHSARGGRCERVTLGFRGPKNQALLLRPPTP
ncbi:hypothetical protein F4553_006684 [Allocatelliglobosispora scoriae]|uniref:Class I SAM-dependent methyltransferase n=1 Tax=Allocatelliglobosispora scoriae TaxID=643052 RepID=A0A841C2Q7_9ACTN|nr:hypothetical protein [Allocatelliglobosispora scoriae]MBB5873250.1 hypothetical protein [Allocatelliglobosispora scoriae]